MLDLYLRCGTYPHSQLIYYERPEGGGNSSPVISTPLMTLVEPHHIVCMQESCPRIQVRIMTLQTNIDSSDI